MRGLFLSLVLASAQAFAIAPHIGDVAKYHVVTQDSGDPLGREHDFTKIMEVNPDPTRSMIHYVFEGNNQKLDAYSDIEKQYVESTFYINEDLKEYCTKNDPSYNSVYENVTVPAGTFASCKILNGAGNYQWVSDKVPFKVLRTDYLDNEGNVSRSEVLTSFQIGSSR